MSCNNCCNNSKTGAQLPTGNSFTNLDFFVIYNPTTGRIEKVQKSTTTGLFLIADNNLSDVDSAATSRNNLDVYSKSEVYTQNQVNGLIAAIPTGIMLQGNWDANTNTPDITGTTETEYFWIVSVAGNTNLGGITDWEVNDWAVKTSTGWAKVDNTQQNPSWGTIIGTLSNQTDLQNELDEKANLTGGNTFEGDQVLEDNLEVQSGITIDNSTVPAQLFLRSPLNNDSAINFIENNIQRVKIGWDDSANLFGVVIGTGAFSTAQVKFFSTIAVLEIDLSLNGNDISNVGNIDAENATFGIEGQSNSISILGDTGEDLTITKNTDGTTTFENTNNENIVIEGDLDVNGVVNIEATTVASLPSGNIGDRSFVTDATTSGFGDLVVGGGGNPVPVFHDGNDWIIG